MKNLTHTERLQSPLQTGLVSELEAKEKTLYRKFENFMSKQRQKNLYGRVKNFHGKNYPIDYKQQFNFTEQWQGKGQSERCSDHNLLQQNGAVYFLYSIAFMVLNVAAVWTISVERYFDTKAISTVMPIYELLVGFTITDIALDIFYKQKLTESQRFELWREIRGHIKHLFVVGYFVWLIIQETKGVIYYILEFAIMVLVYRKASKIYQSMKVTEFNLKYENQMKIIDLLINVFIQAHAFAVIFFSASKMNESKNWVDAAGLSGAGALTQYIYAFYFASTTMLTIGYGDITPKSREEIVVTVVIELVAVVSFGYLLNQMGHTLSKMRQRGEQRDRDLQTISKMSKYYNLDSNLQNKAKSFLFNNQVGEELKVEDEKRVLLKLNEQLRQQIHHENSLNVIKSCIFFVCNWSKTLQSSVARRLQKRIFAPNQRLVPVGGVARIFIIKHGRIDIFMNRFGNSHERGGYTRERRKLLKILSSEAQKEVSDNVYGYTAVFSNRPVRLQAVAAEFTSTYSVTGQEFLKAVRQHSQDFQCFHEIKCRIDQSAFSQQWQAPSINNIRQHYAPSKIITIKKHRKSFQKSLNRRRTFLRREKSNNFNLIQDLAVLTQDQSNVTGINKTIVFTSRDFDKSSPDNILEQNSDKQVEVLNTHSVEELQQDSVKVSLKLAKALLSTRDRIRASEQTENKKVIAHIFENHKVFSNFFRRNNITDVLQSFSQQNFLEKGVRNLNTVSKDSQTQPVPVK